MLEALHWYPSCGWSMLPAAQAAGGLDPLATVEVKSELTGVEVKTESAGVVKQFEELIETVISAIQEPEVTEAGVAAVMARLQAYSDGISRLIATLPSEAANGGDGGVGVGATRV